MRPLFAYFRTYWTATKSPWYLLSILALAALLVYANYAYRLEAQWVRGVSGWGARFPRACLLYALPYWAAFGLQHLFMRGVHRSYLIILIAPILFGLQSTLPIHGLTALYTLRSCCLIIPVIVFWLLRDRGRQSLYGLQQPDTWSYYPYLLLAMIPLLWYAAGQPDFLLMYPRAKMRGAAPLALFEGSYGLDLFSMEFFFRGFLILGMADKDRAHAVLPMALFYCTVHFGKPMAECVSSLFGGLLLGIIALESRSIYVGVLLHLCLAWGLEVWAAMH
ncbi:CPBP family glutamic-type intramembrane protease [Dinghuibacter silviterrae]|uniref:CAAX prenyl protease-like protein n=1 Tax=Dinghuibacter silviterrae TaxID=1539049 RepID=A0A4R8DP92_9BACT|nr:CPBP family glutamic-type intramembrane protease [Dinghuibacter silviterrae]TDW99929.1 CAAX prenyl protease-like protein [Dinghuibacter silviterrae]